VRKVAIPGKRGVEIIVVTAAVRPTGTRVAGDPRVARLNEKKKAGGM